MSDHTRSYGCAAPAEPMPESWPIPSPLPIPGEKCPPDSAIPLRIPRYPKDKDDCNKVRAAAVAMCLAQGNHPVWCTGVGKAAFAGCLFARPFQ
jgi:hypothetical protein